METVPIVQWHKGAWL